MAPTVADLFGDLRRTLDEHGAVADALPHHPGVTRRAADALTGLLDINLGALVLDGWTQYRELRDAARRSLDRPDEDEEVALVDHRISSTHQPSIELYVGDALVGTVVFDLEVYADLHGVDAVVRAGDLVGVRGGDVDVGARLSSQSRVIAERTASYRTGVLLPLATGVPLVGNPKPAHVARLGSRPLRAAVVGALLVVLLGVAGLLSRTDAASTPAAGVPGVVGPETAWNLRAGPDSDAEQVGIVEPGQAVRVECVDGRWARLLDPRAGAFVHRDGLRLDGAPPDCPS